jgi:SAM-dependent methyltransferase
MPRAEAHSDPSWADRAKLADLASVLDPSDAGGGKNLLIDRTQKLALGQALRRLEGSHVLDFGCGKGRISDWLVRHGAIVHGVDTSREMIDFARARVPGANFYLSTADDLNVNRGAYDLVLSVGVLQYLAPGVAQLTNVLTHLAEALRSGGRIAVLEQVHEGKLSWGWPRASYVDSLHEAGFSDLRIRPVRLGHSRFLAAAQRRPFFGAIPGVAHLVQLEARIGSRGPFTGQRYADFLFLARRK